MRSLELEVDDGTVKRLETECELLGFQDLSTYLEWIVDNRTAITQGSDRDELLSAYADRVDELESKLEGDEAQEGDYDGTLTPERVKRITDEELAQQASELGEVERQRVDELARRAVARTRDKLGRTVGTGLSYRSQTAIDDDVRPGEDIADLDSLDLPGYDDRELERRRRAVGAAVAFIRDEEAATRSDVVEALYENYPAGYDSATSWWECIKEGLKQVAAIEGGSGQRKWRFKSPNGIEDTRGVTITRVSNSG